MLRAEVCTIPAVLLAVVALAGPPASAQDAVPIITPTTPNYVGAGLGITTDYIGADDYFFGGLPLARYQFGEGFRYASLVGTFDDLNLVNHPIIRFGPTAQLRLGRSSVGDRAVRRLPSIGKTVEAGAFAGLEFVAPDDPRKRVRLDVRIQQDLASEHDGWLASGGVQGWYPIERLAEVGLALGTSYGSGDYMSTSSASGRRIRRRAGCRPTMPMLASATSASRWASWCRSPSTASSSGSGCCTSGRSMPAGARRS